MNEEVIKELFTAMGKLNKKFDELTKPKDPDDISAGDNFTIMSDYLREAHSSTMAFKLDFHAEKVKRIEKLKSALFSDDVVDNLKSGFLSQHCQGCETDVISENILKDLWLHAKRTNNTFLAKSIALISKEKGDTELTREILVYLLVSDFDELISSEKAIEDIKFQIIEDEDENPFEFTDSIS